MQENDDQPESVNFLQFKTKSVDIEISLKIDVDSFFEYEITPKYDSVNESKARIFLNESEFTVSVLKGSCDKEILTEEAFGKYF